KDDEATSLALQPDGKIVVAGFSQYNATGDYDFAVARLLSNGVLDPSFDTDGKQTVAFDRGGSNNDQANGVALQPDGKIVLAGISQINSTGNYDFAVARLLSNGALDPSFDTDGRQTVAFDFGGSNND